MTFSDQPTSDHPWRWWLLFLVLVLAILSPSIGTSPIVWQDEVQFTDWGRVMLNPHTDWAVTWSAHGHKPLPPVSYLGCIGEELAYELTGTVVGPRLFAISGGLLLGTFVFALMRRQGGPWPLDGLFAALIVLDPGLSQSYCSGRLDAMALAFVLAGTWCVQAYARKQDWRWLVAAALALGCAPYFWIRAVMALPAALLPLVFAADMSQRKLWRSLLALTALSALAGLILSVPAWESLRQTFALAQSPIYLFRDLAGNGGMEISMILPAMLEDMLRCNLPAVPLLLLAALGLFTVFRNQALGIWRKLLVGLVIAVTLACQAKFTTGLHHFTAVYLVPLLIMLAVFAKDRFAPLESSHKPARGLAAGMILLLSIQIFLTMEKSYNAVLDHGSFGPDSLEPTVKALPITQRKLIVDDFRLYFLLRRHGFQPFYLFTDVDHEKREFRSYFPPANCEYQPFYLFTQVGRRGEVFDPSTTPSLLVGGKATFWARWAAIFEPQLRQPVVQQLPLGYRLVKPAQP